MGGFFSAEYHPIYDDGDIKQLKRWFQRFGIIEEDVGNENAIEAADNTQITSR